MLHAEKYYIRESARKHSRETLCVIMKIFVKIVFILQCGALFGQFSMDRYHPQGLIVSKHIDTCYIYDANPNGTLDIQQSIIYDSLGRVLENIQTYQGFRYRYVYNQDGLKVSESLIPIGETPVETDTLLYDNAQNLIERITYSRKEIIRRNKFEYVNGNLHLDSYFSAGVKHVETYYVYNQHNKIDSVKRFVRGRSDGYYKYTYDENENLIGFNSYHAGGRAWLSHKYKVNDDGLRIEFHVFNANGSLTQLYLTNYDSDGLIINTERYTGIKDSDIKNSDHSKQTYKYSYY